MGGIDAALDGRRFFDGATVVRETAAPSYTIPSVQQRLDGSCGAACASSVDQSLGGTLSEADVIKMFPDADFAGKGVKDAPFWKSFANKTGRTSQISNFSGEGLYNNIGSSAASSSRFVLSTHNHSVVLQSVTKSTISKLSGQVIFRYTYNVMDPAYGTTKSLSSNLIRNVFRIF